MSWIDRFISHIINETIPAMVKSASDSAARDTARYQPFADTVSKRFGVPVEASELREIHLMNDTTEQRRSAAQDLIRGRKSES